MKSPNKSRAEAARENGAKSLGPITPEGKQRSSENAFTHGFRSSRTVVPGESEQAYQTLATAYYNLFHPNDVYEHDLVRHIIDCRWRLRRAQQMESSGYTLSICESQSAWDEKYELLQPVHHMFLALNNDGDCARSIDRCLLYEERFQRMGIRSYNSLDKKRRHRNMPPLEAMEAVEAAIPSNFEPPVVPTEPEPIPAPQPEPVLPPQPLPEQKIEPPVTIEPFEVLNSASPELLRALLHTDWKLFLRTLPFIAVMVLTLSLLGNLTSTRGSYVSRTSRIHRSSDGIHAAAPSFHAFAIRSVQSGPIRDH